MVQQTDKKQGRGMLVAGRILLIIAILAVILTLALFIQTTVQNAQDRIMDAIPEFLQEPYGALSGAAAFLLSVVSYLLLYRFYRNQSEAHEGKTEFNISRVLVLIVGIAAVISGIARMMY